MQLFKEKEVMSGRPEKIFVHSPSIYTKKLLIGRYFEPVWRQKTG